MTQMTISADATAFASHGRKHGDERIDLRFTEAGSGPCLFPACRHSGPIGPYVIHMRQGVSARSGRSNRRGVNKPVVFRLSCCAYHSDLSKARKTKKKLSLHQRVCFRNVLETVELRTASNFSKFLTFIKLSTTGNS